MSKPFLEDIETDLLSANRKNPERQIPRGTSAFSGKNAFGNLEKKAHP